MATSLFPDPLQTLCNVRSSFLKTAFSQVCLHKIYSPWEHLPLGLLGGCNREHSWYCSFKPLNSVLQGLSKFPLVDILPKYKLYVFRQSWGIKYICLLRYILIGFIPLISSLWTIPHIFVISWLKYCAGNLLFIGYPWNILYFEGYSYISAATKWGGLFA